MSVIGEFVARFGLTGQGKFKSDIKQMGNSVAKESKKASKKASKSFEGVRLAVARVRNMTLLWKFAMAGTVIAIVGSLKKMANAYAEQKRVESQLEARIKSTGMAAGYTADDLKRMASGLQGVTAFGDEAILGMQTLLLTFTKIGRDTFPQATEAIMNVATAMASQAGGVPDLKSAALQVGKALNDPIHGVTALARSGIQFSVSQKEMIKSLTESGKIAEAQGIILEELEVQFGGAARAARDTFGGKTQALAHAFGDTMEMLGGVVARITTPAIEALTETISELNEVLSREPREKVRLKLIEFASIVRQTEEKMKGMARQTGYTHEELLNLSMSYRDWNKDNTLASNNVKDLTLKLKAMGYEYNILSGEISKVGSSADEMDDKMDDKIAKFEEYLAVLKVVAAKMRELSGKPSILPVDAFEDAEEVIPDLTVKYGNLIRAIERTGVSAASVFANIENYGVSAAHNLAVSFASFAAGGMKNFDDYAKSFGRMLAQMAIEFAAKWAIFAAFSAILPGSSFISRSFLAELGKSFGLKRSAKGNVFGAGGLIPFASGGVINMPTIFPMKNGYGMMGEKGPEAVMPLGRTREGELGVKMIPAVNLSPVFHITLDGQEIRHFIQREDGYDSRTRA